MATKVTTNNVPRPIVNAWELSDADRAEFDYLDWPAIERGEGSAEFFRYKGTLYDLGEFSRVIAPDSVRHHPMECAASEFQGWDGYQGDSFFSGLLIRYADRESFDSDAGIIVGWYCS
jgi:hypothetical protein